MNIATLLNPQDAGNQSAIALANLSSAIASLRNQQSLTNRITAVPQNNAAEAREDTQEQSISHALDSIDTSLQQLTQAQRAEQSKQRSDKALAASKHSITDEHRILDERIRNESNTSNTIRISNQNNKNSQSDIRKESLRDKAITSFKTAGLGLLRGGIEEVNIPLFTKMTEVIGRKTSEWLSKRNHEEETNTSNQTNANHTSDISTLEAIRRMSNQRSSEESSRTNIISMRRGSDGVFRQDDNENDEVRTAQMADDISAHRQEDNQHHKTTTFLLEEISSKLDNIGGGDGDGDFDMDFRRRSRGRGRMSRRGRMRGRARSRGFRSRMSRGFRSLRGAGARAMPLLAEAGGMVMSGAKKALPWIGKRAAKAIPLVGAALGGWEVGGYLKEGIDSVIQKATGEKDATLGTKLYDWTHDEKGRNKIGLAWDRFWGNAPSEEEEKAEEARKAAILQAKIAERRKKNQEAQAARESIESKSDTSSITKESNTTTKESNVIKHASNTINNPTIIESPKTTSFEAHQEESREVRELEHSAMQAEKQQVQPQPIIIEQPKAESKSIPTAPRGQDSHVPVYTRSNDTTLSRIGDNMMLAGL
nr:MAG TPA: hypothetical protein [Caudoviricetes sp.]DAX23374.1 MAG TPA: hypothetical protein [Caudoviricetes sp.]